MILVNACERVNVESTHEMKATKNMRVKAKCVATCPLRKDNDDGGVRHPILTIELPTKCMQIIQISYNYIQMVAD